MKIESLENQNDSTADQSSEDSGLSLKYADGINTNSREDSSASNMMMLTLKSMLTEMKRKREKKIQIQKQEDIAEQWKHVAAMYDRILFVVFICVILGITIWFLSLNPTVESQREG